ncbi:MAG: PhzF family phenazine biosynthesis protein [Gammaproteobacteria bacterium]|nr:PhzF family phenazine biosynthesis protein [Gammaproteobacteria bacterium]
MKHKIYQVDAFTSKPFGGNPAAVCLLSGPVSDGWMQQVAAEMNLSETAFLLPLASGEADFSLRWFTPRVEVNLCGHATLASAHVVWQSGLIPGSEAIRFKTLSGLLSARSEMGRIVLDFPASRVVESDMPEGLVDALGIAPVALYRGGEDLLVLLKDKQAVEGLSPDFVQLARQPVRGVIVTASAAGSGFDFVSRFFGPAVGIDEDPVTGSAHCLLAPFWAERLGKTEMRGWQASRRGGEVGVRLVRDRVDLIGEAVTVMAGELNG